MSPSMSLLRYNSSLSKQKNEMVSMNQRLQAKLEFFKTSLLTDMEKYQEQTATGIGKNQFGLKVNPLEQTGPMFCVLPFSSVGKTPGRVEGDGADRRHLQSGVELFRPAFWKFVSVLKTKLPSRPT